MSLFQNYVYYVTEQYSDHTLVKIVSPLWFVAALHLANCRVTDATAGHELLELANFYN